MYTLRILLEHNSRLSFDYGVQHFANLFMIFIYIFFHFGYLASYSLHLYLIMLMQASHCNDQIFLKWPSAAFKFSQHSLSSLSEKVDRSEIGLLRRQKKAVKRAPLHSKCCIGGFMEPGRLFTKLCHFVPFFKKFLLIWILSEK